MPDIKKPIIVAGPCSAESRKQIFSTADALASAGIELFRAGIWKPRTRPDSFEGVGAEGLPWLVEAGKAFGMKVCTEVACAHHVEQCLDAGIDFLWIGARTTTNPFLVQEISDVLKGVDIPVLVKNPVSPDIDLWTGAVERLNKAGITRIAVVHRGFQSVDPGLRYRNDPRWHIAIEMRSRFPGIPFLCDPSHIAGDKVFVEEISRKAMSLGLDGLMVESHIDPGHALSDSAQQLTPSALAEMLANLSVRDGTADKEVIGSLRSRIDSIDSGILKLLAERMETSREIGAFKRDGNIPILQTSRWNEVLSTVTAKAKEHGLDESFVRALFNLIHEASVREQE